MRKPWVFIILLISFSAIIIIGLILNPLPAGSLSEDTFWMNKIDMKADYDIVLAGDSRIYCDLSPGIMKEALPGYAIANYGFAGTGYEPEYLKALAALFSGKNCAKVLVLGITPHSLTPMASKQNDFLYLKSINANDRYIRKTFGMLFHIVQPVDLPGIISRITGRKTYKLYEEFQPDGWLASDIIPPDPGIAYKHYSQLFINNRISPDVVNRLHEEIRKFTARKILVLGFRPPTSNEMVELENRLSLFDGQAFINAFNAAGGIWIDVSQDDYECSDGSHLRKESAIRFSRDFAKQVRDMLQLINCEDKTGG